MPYLFVRLFHSCRSTSDVMLFDFDIQKIPLLLTSLQDIRIPVVSHLQSSLYILESHRQPFQNRVCGLKFGVLERR